MDGALTGGFRYFYISNKNAHVALRIYVSYCSTHTISSIRTLFCFHPPNILSNISSNLNYTRPWIRGDRMGVIFVKNKLEHTEFAEPSSSLPKDKATLKSQHSFALLKNPRGNRVNGRVV